MFIVPFLRPPEVVLIAIVYIICKQKRSLKNLEKVHCGLVSFFFDTDYESTAPAFL